MNAAPVHIQFYFRKWTNLFPDARIIIVLGTIPDMLYRRDSTQKQNLGPLLSALRAEPDSPLYVHLFSNAGAHSAAMLLRAYKESSNNRNHVLPLRGLVLDSAPSLGSYESSFVGMVYQVPHNPILLHYLSVLLVHALVITAFALEALSGNLNVLSQSYDDLNNTNLLLPSVPRIYYYSKEDGLVKWQDVEHHAAIAESRGWAVEKQEFEGTDHCRHGKGPGEARYWKSIKTLVAKG